MSRHLAVSLEPSDAFLALLRLKAASEVGRWPAQLSGRFRASLDREFASLESAVRTLGVCYADLEERGIEFDLLPWCQHQRMRLMAYCPIGQGGAMLAEPVLNATTGAVSVRNTRGPRRAAW